MKSPRNGDGGNRDENGDEGGNRGNTNDGNTNQGNTKGENKTGDEKTGNTRSNTGVNNGGGAWSDYPFTMGGSGNTARLLAILDELPGGSKRVNKAILSVVGPFPVAGLAWWSDDWHAPRCCPSPHLHQGLDIMARRGTPVVAVADGYVSQKVNHAASSGLGLEITDDSGTEYFYAHLDRFAEGIRQGQQVAVGDVLGYVGDTGNARGGIPHLHFEVQPNGVPVPPMPFVNKWLQVAERRAIALVERVTGKTFRPKLGQIKRWAELLRELISKAKNLFNEDVVEDREVLILNRARSDIGEDVGATRTSSAAAPVGAAGVGSAAAMAIAALLFALASVGLVRRRRSTVAAEQQGARGNEGSGQAGDEGRPPASRHEKRAGGRRGSKGAVVAAFLVIFGLLAVLASRAVRQTLLALIRRQG